jgi:isoleucyl-tRNA synthetase
MTGLPKSSTAGFDRGSMPYAQWHYPFEHKDDFHNSSPPTSSARAGPDQGLVLTRSWPSPRFLFDQSSFKSVLVNDLVLDKDGQRCPSPEATPSTRGI